jgi:hypothetical protein
MVLDGLITAHAAGIDHPQLESIIAKGIRGTWSALFDAPSGEGRVSTDRSEPMWLQYKALHAWCFQAGGDLTGSDRYQGIARRVLRHLFRFYRQADGRFVLSPIERGVYVRPSAQLFHELARIHERVPEWAS